MRSQRGRILLYKVMTMRVLRQILLIFCILGLPVTEAAPVAAAGGGTPAVDASVRETLARGKPADVLILLGAQPDLSPAQALPTKEARGRWVYETLRVAADRDQAPLVAELARAGVPYRRFWVVNAVQARLNASQLQRVLALPRVTRVAANLSARAVEPLPVVAAGGAAALAAPAAIEWGVSRVKAPWAWSPGLHRPGDRRRRAGHRLRVESPGADQCVSRLQPRDRHRRPRLQLARQHSRRHRQSLQHEPLRLRQPRPVR